jgi:hypothetical protein
LTTRTDSAAAKTKKTANFAVFLSANQSWWSITDVKITINSGLGREDYDILELRRLNDELNE